jgi:hypothetical protein
LHLQLLAKIIALCHTIVSYKKTPQKSFEQSYQINGSTEIVSLSQKKIFSFFQSKPNKPS